MRLCCGGIPEMNNLPLLSVIVPVYNTEKFVKRCLDSILNQTYPNIEIIIVDDASPGNIKEIYQEYKNENTIKLVCNIKNLGLFGARAAGIKRATGEYIAFVDSDDRVSCDYYRKLINRAIETDSDMVAGEFVLEQEDGSLMRRDYTNLNYENIWLENNQIAEKLFNQKGLDYAWHVVWNKIYRKDLIERSWTFIEKQTENLTMCEDVAFSCLFYTLAKRFTNVHGDWYYYYQNSSSSTKHFANNKKIGKNLRDIKIAFTFACDVLKKLGIYEHHARQLIAWEKLIYKNWVDIIKNSKLSFYHKKQLISIIYQLCNVKDENFNSDDWFFLRYTSPILQQNLVRIKEQLWNMDYEYISFDIFDTLIVRPFWKPEDIFMILDQEFSEKFDTINIVDFSTMRIQAEQIARSDSSKGEEITLDDIYSEINKILKIDLDSLEKIKRREIELELEYCYPRQTGKELYNYAISIKKKSNLDFGHVFVVKSYKRNIKEEWL